MSHVSLSSPTFSLVPDRVTTACRRFPSQVPAGLHADLQVQIFTLSAAQVGEEEPRKHIVQDIPIHTEVDILYLPVTANILSVPSGQI